MASGCVRASIIGCVVALVVGIVTVAAIGLFAKSWFSNVIASERSDFGKRMVHLRSEYPYKKEGGDKLSEQQVTRFFGVVKTMAAYRTQHEAKFRQLDKELEKEDNPLVGAFKFYMKFGNGLRTAMVTGLEEQRMSLEEYDYVHVTLLKTLGAMMHDQAKETPQYKEAQNQIKDIQRQMEQNPQYQEWINEVGNISEENKHLVIQHKEDFDKYFPSAPFSFMLFPLLSMERSS